MKEFERRTLCEALELTALPPIGSWTFEKSSSLLTQIGYKLRSLLEEGLPKDADPECLTCLRQGPHMGPSHRGSKRCESGSLASGGKNAHCTCDTCF